MTQFNKGIMMAHTGVDNVQCEPVVSMCEIYIKASEQN